MGFRYDTNHLSGQQKAIIRQREREEEIRKEEEQKKKEKKEKEKVEESKDSK